MNFDGFLSMDLRLRLIFFVIFNNLIFIVTFFHSIFFRVNPLQMLLIFIFYDCK